MPLKIVEVYSFQAHKRQKWRQHYDEAKESSKYNKKAVKTRSPWEYACGMQKGLD